MKLSILLFTVLSFPARADTNDNKEHHKQMLVHSGGDMTRALALQEKHSPAESRIVGGTEAEVGKYPFFVEWEGCGASLIHPDIILTAAHCFGIEASTVRVGSSRRGFFGVGEEERGLERNIVQKERHPLYQESTVDYDYLVMKLDSAVDIEPIGLNDDGQSPSSGDTLTVIGYGTLSEGGSAPNSLQEVDLSYIPTADCNDAYDGEINGNTMICAGDGGGKDSCQGDSGGPIFQIKNGQPVQVGIVSWGYGCARPEYPGVYSRVSGELDWIQQQICQLTEVEPKPSYCGSSGGGGGGGGGGDETPVEGKVSVRLDITYDKYPVENSWVVRRGQTVIASKELGTQLTQGLVEERLNLDPGTHDFEFRDSFGDGICCSFGSGGFAIYAELPSGDVMLASGDGNFGTVVMTQFVVPAADDGTPVTSVPVFESTAAPTSVAPQTPSPGAGPVNSPVAGPVISPTAGPALSPVAGPVSSPPVAGPVISPTAGPALSPVAGPVSSPPVAGPVNSPVAGPVNSPVAGPVISPTAAPALSPVARPVNSPVAGPVNSPVAGPVSSPTAAPAVDSPVAAAPAANSPIAAAPTTTVISPVACKDGDGTFLVDNDVTGSRNCLWLQQNLANFGYLCKFVVVAAECQATCDACDYFTSSRT